MIEWFPAVSVVVNVATPSTRSAVPMRVPASKNCTLPVGVAVPGGLTLTRAVSVTGAPAVVGGIGSSTVVAPSLPMIDAT